MFRAAGRILGQMDDSYAKAIRGLGPKNPESKMGQAGKVAAELFGVDRKGTLFDSQDPRYNPMQDTVGKSVLVGARYAVPAAMVGGVTLAGKALIELTQDYQTAGTLRPE